MKKRREEEDDCIEGRVSCDPCDIILKLVLS